MFQKESGSQNYHLRFNLLDSDEINFHFGKRDSSQLSYEEAMFDIAEKTENVLKKAQIDGRPYIMFVHGKSTSLRGKQTTRSVVRSFMRSKQATQFVIKNQCIQHESVFIAKLRL